MTQVRDIRPEIPQWKRRLYLPSYSVTDSAFYAGTTLPVVSYWHQHRGGAGPALPGKEKGKALSYLQLVEVAFVATMRDRGVSLQKIRKSREYARQQFKVDYPFAQLKWKTNGVHLLLTLRDVEGDGDVESLIAADTGGQEGWQSAMAERFEQFEYEGDLALKWHVRGKQNPVIIDPRVSFGAPTICGLPTWVIRERRDAGETVDEIQQDFGLEVSDINYALEFEGVSVGS